MSNIVSLSVYYIKRHMSICLIIGDKETTLETQRKAEKLFQVG